MARQAYSQHMLSFTTKKQHISKLEYILLYYYYYSSICLDMEPIYLAYANPYPLTRRAFTL